MSKKYFSRFNVDEINFIIDFFTQHIAEYKLNELTNGLCGDVPSINNAHPLALEFGSVVSSSSSDGNYTSLLPAIGVELISDIDNPINVMGRGFKTGEITQAFITEKLAIQMKNRWKEGTLVSNTILSELQVALTAKIAAGEKLYTREYLELQAQNIAVSIWCNDPTVNRILYLVIRSLLKRIKLAFANEGVKNMKMSSNNSLYNYDFSETLFGSEFTLDIVQYHQDIEVDTDLATIDNVTESAKYPTGNVINGNVTGKPIQS